MSDQQFRSTAFGGFNKQDVLNYIETATGAHTAQTEALQKELDQVKAQCAAFETEKTALSATCVSTTAELEEAAATLEWANAEMEKKNARLAALETESAALRDRVQALEPSAQAYQVVKDRTAGIELEAHCRAQAAESAAQEHIKKAKAELEQWMIKVQAGYNRLRTDVDATIAHADGELGRVAKTLEGIAAEFSDHDEALEELLHAYREAQGPQAPKPLDLD